MINKPQVRVMLIDDHSIVRSGIRRLLEQHPEYTIVAEGDSGEQASPLYNESMPDITIMDLSMPGMGGMEAISRIVTRHRNAKILILSMHENAAFASQALKAGAKGYLSKTSLAEELLNALEVVLKGQTYLHAEIAKKIAFQALEVENNPLQVLSAKEFEIFRMTAEGRETEEIAEALKISGKTVSNYQTMIKQKLGVNGPIEIVRMAIKYGILNE
jgi:two-component system invasion response regulator UvrY